MNRMNWGCGGDLHEGWDNVDRADYGDRATRHDIVSDGPLPFEDQQFDLIVANHSLQQLRYRDVVPALRELRRVLVDGGLLRIIVPDVAAGFRAWEDGNRAWFPNSPEETCGEAFTAWLTWYGDNLTGFTLGALWEAVSAAGFEHIADAGYQVSRWGGDAACVLDTRPNESIFLEAVR